MKSKSFVAENMEYDDKIKLAKLIGYLIGDGSIVINRKKTIFSIRLENTDKTLRQEFNKLVYEIFKETTRTYNNDREQVSSSTIGSFILELMNTARTKACYTFPKCPKTYTCIEKRACRQCQMQLINKIAYPTITFPGFIETEKECSRAFLKAIFSCDGGVTITVRKEKNRIYFEKAIVFSSKNPQVRNYVEQLLQKFGINLRFDGYASSKISSYEGIEKFRKEIGFTVNCKVRRTNSRFFGIAKNELLDLLMEMRKKPYGFWVNNFETKAEVFNYLLSTLQKS